MTKRVKNAVTVDTVHTHTQWNLINKNIEGMLYALLKIYIRDG